MNINHIRYVLALSLMVGSRAYGANFQSNVSDYNEEVRELRKEVRELRDALAQRERLTDHLLGITIEQRKEIDGRKKYERTLRKAHDEAISAERRNHEYDSKAASECHVMKAKLQKVLDDDEKAKEDLTKQRSALNHRAKQLENKSSTAWRTGLITGALIAGGVGIACKLLSSSSLIGQRV